jgi:hypothetical protein
LSVEIIDVFFTENLLVFDYIFSYGFSAFELQSIIVWEKIGGA